MAQPMNSTPFPYASMNDIDLKPIGIDSLRHQFTCDINPNERAYDEKVKIHNNAYVQRWHDEYLVDYVDKDNQVTVRKGLDLWEVWNQGQEIRGLMKVIKHLPETPEDVIDWWKKIFELPVEEIIKLERPAIANGYHVLQQYYGMWVAKEKYDKVFKHAYPLWYDKYREHNLLFTRKIEPFDLGRYQAKLQAIMVNGIRPRK